ncbi:MAG: Eco57I restriction-modification methylase domain-containing protein [Ruminococcus sp.]|nr:Eco57I restriction-modification methylase domain-containing protein [Ruminococcus sp.]
MEELIKLDAYPIRGLVGRLLQDKTTRKNIMFASDSYADYGAGYRDDSQMTEGALLGFDSCDIQPRVYKAASEQTERTRKRAEVFTPAWIVNQMNNHCDAEWFGRADVFNRQDGQSWTVRTEPIVFPEGKTWKQYVDSRRLEITCGEAPYIVSRYDTSTGEIIPIERRIGILDRKLRVINENAADEDEWFKWALRAFQSVYGYEYQGDNLLIARMNLLYTLADYIEAKWHRQASRKELEKFLNVICWNIWQMDGMNDTPPYGIPNDEVVQLSLFEDDETNNDEIIYCKIYDWRKDISNLFKGLKKRGKGMKFDFVIGNPPYQEEADIVVTTNGQKPRKNIFHHFQIAADEISSEGSVLIYPGGRWLHQSGKGLKDFGKNQINDVTLKSVFFYPESKVVFGKSADLSDGITIVIKMKSKTTGGFKYSYMSDLDNGITVDVDNPGDDLLPLNPNDLLVASKIKKFVEKYNLSYLHDAILPRSLFSIESDYIEKNPTKATLYIEGMDVDYSKKVKVLTNDRAGKAGRAKWFVIDRSEIKQNKEYIDKWKVIVSSANAGGQKRDNQIAIADNHSAFGRARLALRSFDTYEEALNFFNYCNTYIIRYAFLMTDEALSSLGKQVPDLVNYNNSQIIDFSENLDKQLFELIDFSDKEIDYIKHRIDDLRSKEME